MAVNHDSPLLYPVAPVHSPGGFDEAIKNPVKPISKARLAQVRARALARAASRGSLWLQLLFFSCADPVFTFVGAFLVWFTAFLSVLLLPLCCVGIIAFNIPLALSRAFSNAYAWSFRTLGLPCPPLLNDAGPRGWVCVRQVVALSSWRAFLYVAVVRPLVHYAVWCVMKLLVAVAFTGLVMPITTAILRGVAGHANAGVAIGGLLVGLVGLALALGATYLAGRITGLLATVVLAARCDARGVGYEAIGTDAPLLAAAPPRAECSAGRCCAKTLACGGLAACTLLVLAGCFVLSFAVYGGIACHTAVPVGNATYALALEAPHSTLAVDALEAGGPIARWLGVRVELTTGPAAAANLLQTAVPGTAALFAGSAARSAFVVGPTALRLSGGCLRPLLQDIATCPRATVRLTVPVAPPPDTSVSVRTHGRINAKECCGGVPLAAVLLNTTVGCVKLGATTNATSIHARSVFGKVKAATLGGPRLASIVLASRWGKVKAARKDGESLEADNITIESGGWRRVKLGVIAPRVAANVSARGDVVVRGVRLATDGARTQIKSCMGDVDVESAVFTAPRATLAVSGGWWGDAEVHDVVGFAGNFTVCSRSGDALFTFDPFNASYAVSYSQRDESCMRGRVARAAGGPSGMELSVQAQGGDAAVDALH